MNPCYLGLFVFLKVLSFHLPVNAMMHPAEDSVRNEVGHFELTSSHGDDFYQSVKQIFWLVSSSNCETTTHRNLFSCRPPMIRLEEASGHLPPLPYETKVQIRTTPPCRGRVDATVGTLHARLGQFREEDEVGDFLKEEVLTFSQSQIFILNRPQGYPFKNLTIAPRSPEIFTGARFPEGCEISIEIEFNRIALKTRGEAHTYLSHLRDQVGLMTRLSSSLLLLHESRTQQGRNKSLLNGLEGLGSQRKTKIAQVQGQWEALQGITRALETNMRRNQALASDPHLQALTESMATFSRVLNQATTSQELVPETLRGLVSQACSRDEELLEAQLDQFLDPEPLWAIQLRLASLNLQVAVTERSLQTYFRDCEYPRCFEDLGDLFFSELCGPHGVIDEMRHGILKMGPCVDQALPRSDSL